MTSPNGTHCVETADVMRFVGQGVGLAPPAGSAEDAAAMEVTLLMQVAMDRVFYALLKPMVVNQACNYISEMPLPCVLEVAAPAS
mgnify:CR=1 FL=1